jgi:hypothetical protein
MRAFQINLVSQVVPHEKLIETAEVVARTILRNDQASIRSAKRVTLDMVGRSLDDQLYREAYAAYTLMARNPTVPELLKNFYEKTGKGRHSVNATRLQPSKPPNLQAWEARPERVTLSGDGCDLARRTPTSLRACRRRTASGCSAARRSPP